MSEDTIKKDVVLNAVKKFEELKKDCKNCVYCNKINIIIDEQNNYLRQCETINYKTQSKQIQYCELINEAIDIMTNDFSEDTFKTLVNDFVKKTEKMEGLKNCKIIQFKKT